MKLLPWLIEAPANFNSLCESLSDSDDILNDAIALAKMELTVNQSHRLYRTISKSEPIKLALSAGIGSFKLGIVSNGTIDLLLPSLVVSALRHGIYLEIVAAAFDQVIQEAIDPDSKINQSKPDAVLLALDYRAFPFGNDTWASCPKGTSAKTGLELLKQIRDGFRLNCGAISIVQTLAMPPRSLMGNMDGQMDGLLRKEIANFNAQTLAMTSSDSDVALDIANIVEQVGTQNWFDERQWLMARIPMANEYIPLYGEHLARLIAACRGKTRKCLVLDLDNTLWGGVIGDDGMEGIVIGQGNPMGEAHLALQKYAQELKSVGILLAVCSKNEESIAREVFREHPDMLLREDDFVAFSANWENKASNIKNIAATLNIGLDSIVFVDDNPAEREIVRTFLPQVAVPELPEDPAMFPRTLSAAGYFEMVNFNPEDAMRTQQYVANKQRDQALNASGGVEEFLRSLNMKMTISPFDKLGRKRITQLINKTNQFNLNTRRHTEGEVAAFEESEEFHALQVRLTDRFGDNGMVSVVICQKQQEVWDIQNWLMSCRVIKRRAEDAICDELVRQAIEAGATTLRGTYYPTERNLLVKNHYQDMGFTKDASENDREVWTLVVTNYAFKHPPIEIVSSSAQVGELN